MRAAIFAGPRTVEVADRPDPVAAPASDPGVANRRDAHGAARLPQAVREDGASLVPLRLFVGLGWLRAGAEKVVDPGWRDGSSLAGLDVNGISGWSAGEFLTAASSDAASRATSAPQQNGSEAIPLQSGEEMTMIDRTDQRGKPFA